MSTLLNNFSAPLTGDDEDACLYALQLVTFPVFPVALNAAVELGVLQIIAEAGPGTHLSPSEISVRLGTANPQAPVMLDRILRLLASYSVVSCNVDGVGADGLSGDRCYGAAPITKFLAKDDDGVSLSTVFLLNSERVIRESWYHLKDTVMDGGIPFNRGNGMPLFEYLGKDARLNRMFNEGMRGHSTIVMKKLLERYEGFHGVGVLVDVGGGIGKLLGMIVAKHPHVKGINFDLTHVISRAPALSGVEHVGGDMFESIPSGDAIFMKSILHDWSDEDCVKILKNCWKALPENGKLILTEIILPVSPETTSAKDVFQVDLIMLALHGGKERTAKEFETLATGAGFSDSKLLVSYANHWVIEFSK